MFKNVKVITKETKEVSKQPDPKYMAMTYAEGIGELVEAVGFADVLPTKNKILVQTPYGIAANYMKESAPLINDAKSNIFIRRLALTEIFKSRVELAIYSAVQYANSLKIEKEGRPFDTPRWDDDECIISHHIRWDFIKDMKDRIPALFDIQFYASVELIEIAIYDLVLVFIAELYNNMMQGLCIGDLESYSSNYRYSETKVRNPKPKDIYDLHGSYMEYIDHVSKFLFNSLIGLCVEYDLFYGPAGVPEVSLSLK